MVEMPSNQVSNSCKPSGTKQKKRDFDLVSPDSPDSPITMSGFRVMLKQEVEKITAEITEVKNVIKSNSDSLESFKLSTGIDIEDVKRGIQFNSDTLDSLKVLTEKVINIELGHNKLASKVEAYEERICQLEERLISLEGRSRRNNLKFLNVKNTTHQGATENCESLIIQLCKDNGIELNPRSIERAHRVGFKGPKDRPIIVKFFHYKDRQAILQAKGKFKDIGILVFEDFVPEVISRRKMFTPVLHAVHASGGKYKAKLNMDKLIVNSKQYTTTDLEKLPDDINPYVLSTVKKGETTAFFTRFSKLSNHFPSQFKLDGVTFASVEQFYMYKAAKHFGEEATATSILSSVDPVVAKKLGSKVCTSNKAAWDSVRDKYMREGLIAKFTQNHELGEFLKSTGNSTLIEANPKDKYWGVGLALQDENIWIKNKWVGQNKLGRLLVQIRQTLM